MDTISENVNSPPSKPTTRPVTMAKDSPTNKLPVLKQMANSTAMGISMSSPFAWENVSIWAMSPMVPPCAPKMKKITMAAAPASRM